MSVKYVELSRESVESQAISAGFGTRISRQGSAAITVAILDPDTHGHLFNVVLHHAEGRTNAAITDPMEDAPNGILSRRGKPANGANFSWPTAPEHRSRRDGEMHRFREALRREFSLHEGKLVTRSRERLRELLETIIADDPESAPSRIVEAVGNFLSKDDLDRLVTAMESVEGPENESRNG